MLQLITSSYLPPLRTSVGASRSVSVILRESAVHLDIYNSLVLPQPVTKEEQTKAAEQPTTKDAPQQVAPATE